MTKSRLTLFCKFVTLQNYTPLTENIKRIINDIKKRDEFSYI